MKCSKCNLELLEGENFCELEGEIVCKECLNDKIYLKDAVEMFGVEILQYKIENFDNSDFLYEDKRDN